MAAIAYAKWIGIALSVFAIAAGSFHLGSLGPKAELAKYQAAQALAGTHEETKQLNTNVTAEKAHDEDLNYIDLHVVRTPVLVCDNPPAANRVPVPSEAGHPAAQSGGTDPGPRERDVRDELSAFEVKYEKILADCRRLDAEWPK